MLVLVVGSGECVRGSDSGREVVVVVAVYSGVFRSRGHEV